jgi:hypothetical protein
MATQKVYRWSIKTDNVYAFAGFEFTGTLSSYKNEVSGFIRKDRVYKLLSALVGYGVENLKMVTAERYWKEYNKHE